LGVENQPIRLELLAFLSAISIRWSIKGHGHFHVSEWKLLLCAKPDWRWVMVRQVISSAQSAMCIIRWQ